MAIRYLSGINVDSNTLFVDSTNNRVGIGTATPAYPLDVTGNIGISDNSKLINAGGTQTYITFSSGASEIAYQDTLNFRAFNLNNPLSAMFLSSAGNVGIGTTSPEAQLDISSGSTSILRLSNSDTALSEGQLTGLIEFYQSDSTSGGTGISGRIGMRSSTRTDSGIYFGNVGDMSFFVSGQSDGAASDNATKEALTIRAGNGNVGIGTTSPGAKLDVAETLDPILRLTSTSTTTTGAAGSSTGRIEFYGNSSAGNGAGIKAVIDTAATTTTRRDFDLLFKTSGNVGSGEPLERMRITTDGNVLIGTTTDTGYRLNVVGEVSFSPNTAGKNTFTFTTNAANDARLLLKSDTTTKVDIQANGDSYFNGGNVGIGTNNPGALLDIVGNSNSADYMVELFNTKYGSTDTTGETSILFGWLNHSAATITAFKEGTVNRTGFKIIGEAGFNVPTTIATFRSTGRVGIGTTDPVEELHVVGDTRTTRFLLTDSGDVGRLTLDIDANDDTVLTTGTTDGTRSLLFYTENTERMRIASNGVVRLNTYGSGGITGAPTYNLAVDSSGNIIETAGGVVDGSGTANTITKWQDANTVTNSSMTDDGTTVTATAANLVSQSNLGTAYTSFSTSGTTAIFDTITRANAAIYQIVIVANPNSAGSGSYADFYYGKVFIGTGFNGSAVVEFINYHQESPMPRTLYGSGGGDLTVTAVMLVGGTEFTEIAVDTSYTIRIKIAGYNVAGSNTTVRLQRIM
jgi:hypothetical protein